MPAPKGHPKWGGRKKGTPNKSTQEVEIIATRLGLHPFEVLLLFAKGDWRALGYESEKYVAGASEYGTFYKYTIDPAVRAKCAAEATQYLSPKRKAIDHTVSDDLGLAEKLKLAKQRSKKDE